MRLRAFVYALAAAALVTGAASAEPRHFTFSWAAHAPENTGLKAAEDFVAKDLPVGLPMDEALARAKDAGTRCRGAGGPDEPVTCSYEIAAGSGEATLGEEVWVLSLTPDGNGALASATVDRKRIGVPGDLDTKPTFTF